MGEFRDYLNMLSEMSIAGYGDWEPSAEMLVTMSVFV